MWCRAAHTLRDPGIVPALTHPYWPDTFTGSAGTARECGLPDCQQKNGAGSRGADRLRRCDHRGSCGDACRAASPGSRYGPADSWNARGHADAARGGRRRTEPRRVLRVIAEQGVAIELLDGDDLYYAAVAGSLASHSGERLPVTGSLSGTAITTQAPVYCDDARADVRVNRETRSRLGIRSMCIGPLLSGRTALGVFKIASAEVAAFGTDDLYRLELLAGSLTAALLHIET